MCGISGFQGSFDPVLLGRMNDIIAHRGPDDCGIYYDPSSEVGLAHRRLSIIDLSPLGSQPMWDWTGTVAIVFNGEIYNFQDLRGTLVSQGYRFRSRTDTEVLLNLYLRDGSSMLEKLNGIFAFAIFDRRDRSLFLGRDGVGVKPLYYSEASKGFIFSSELKVLLAEPSIPREICAEAVHSYVTYLWCPSPRTMLKAVKKLEPGWALKVRNGRVERRWQFYELPYTDTPASVDLDEAIECLQARLKASVKRQLISDAPLGAFLSGGLDSSSIVAMAREFTDSSFSCFAIVTRNAQREGFVDDSAFARVAAQHLDVRLHTIEADAVAPTDLPAMVYHLDEPQADPAALLVAYISQLARDHGVKVLLSGAGGDDILCGYRRHRALLLEKYWSWLPVRVRRVVREATEKLPVSRPLLRRVRKAFEYADRSENERILGYFQWIAASRTRLLYGPHLRDLATSSSPSSNGLLASLEKLPKTLPPISRLLFLDAKHFLTDHNLNYTDKMSMAHGVEVRVPFLDPDLMSFVASLPPDFKQRGSVGKWILRRAMKPFLHSSILARPKTGFMVPIRSWFQKPIPDFLSDLLSAATLSKHMLFDSAEVQRLLDMSSRGMIDAAYPLLAVACVELWLKTFVDPPTPTRLSA